jgi:hypothetical protein
VYLRRGHQLHSQQMIERRISDGAKTRLRDWRAQENSAQTMLCQPTTLNFIFMYECLPLAAHKSLLDSILLQAGRRWIADIFLWKNSSRIEV